MAFTWTHLNSGEQGGTPSKLIFQTGLNGTDYTATSELTYLLFVTGESRNLNQDRTVDGVVGWGLTWTERHEVQDQLASDRKVSAVYSATGTPTNTVLDVTFSGALTNISGFAWHLIEADGTNTGTTDGIVANTSGDVVANGTAIAHVLASFADATNNASVIFTWFAVDIRTLQTGGGGYTIINQTNVGESRVGSLFKVGEDLSPTAQASAGTDIMSIAIEIAASGATTTAQLSDLFGITDQIVSTVTLFKQVRKLADLGPDTGADTSLDTIRTYQMSEKLRP